MKLVWYRLAQDDLLRVSAYIKEDNPKAAEKVTERLVRAVEHLKKFPNAGRRGRVPLTREIVIPEYPYIIRYRVKDEAVQILRVFHGAREWIE